MKNFNLSESSVTLPPKSKRYSVIPMIMMASALLLSGCKNVPKKIIAIDNQTYKQRQAQLLQLNNWTITGKFIFKSADKKRSASLYWAQKDQHADIRLTSFLGISILSMTNDQNGATLTADGKTYQSNNPQQLLENSTGLTIPVADMPLWMKGAKSAKGRNRPRIEQYTLDKLNRIQTLNLQDEDRHSWQIDYQEYQQVNQYYLPKTIKLSGNGITIIFKISAWELPSDNSNH